ncbi:MAG: sugar phosphate nucleotidyltransferase [Candidatus Bathyarchaeia archaeon]
MGTAGALYAAREYFDGTFIVYYGDALTNMNLTDMIEFHKRKNSISTVALSKSVPIDYGIGKVDGEGKLAYFAEKPVL